MAKDLFNVAVRSARACAVRQLRPRPTRPTARHSHAVAPPRRALLAAQRRALGRTRARFRPAAHELGGGGGGRSTCAWRCARSAAHTDPGRGASAVPQPERFRVCAAS
jgi:hypothetical protein